MQGMGVKYLNHEVPTTMYQTVTFIMNGNDFGAVALHWVHQHLTTLTTGGVEKHRNNLLINLHKQLYKNLTSWVSIMFLDVMIVN